MTIQIVFLRDYGNHKKGQTATLPVKEATRLWQDGIVSNILGQKPAENRQTAMKKPNREIR